MIAADLNSHRKQLLLTIAVITFAISALLSHYQSRSRQELPSMKRSLSEKTSSNRVQPSPSSVLPASESEYAKHLVREQLARWRGEHRAHAKRVGRDRWLWWSRELGSCHDCALRSCTDTSNRFRLTPLSTVTRLPGWQMLAHRRYNAWRVRCVVSRQSYRLSHE